ncbi:MAG: c-type cytochrome [Cellvibrionaceae bacterium]|nr:c-type cytochrome [Cellvibrionaceae bacterium]MCV6627296.1 c-type cytochrome [Cellvibrionaceae bacterium]
MSHAKKVISLVSAAALAAAVSAVVWAGEADDTVKARIAPVGEVCMAGDDCAGAQAAAPAAAASGPRAGADIYNSACMACHTTGASGAPKIGDAAAWGPRVAKGMDVLYNSAINGLNAVMPAKGMCMDCSDDELKATVDYMVENSK